MDPPHWLPPTFQKPGPLKTTVFPIVPSQALRSPQLRSESHSAAPQLINKQTSPFSPSRVATTLGTVSNINNIISALVTRGAGLVTSPTIFTKYVDSHAATRRHSRYVCPRPQKHAPPPKRHGVCTLPTSGANFCLLAFHGGDDDAVEQEYDRLRDLAREEADKRNRCFERVHSPLPLCCRLSF